MAISTDIAETDATEFVTVAIGDQLFGLPISRVQDVFVPDRLTRVPLAPPDIAGLLNLRGRIVTAIDMRARLGLGPRARGQEVMAIGIEVRGESYGLLVDSVGEVVNLSTQAMEPKPANLESNLARVATGIHRLESQLLVVLDVDRVLDLRNAAIAA
jgi:purine-binding chemotaxis protein CheW